MLSHLIAVVLDCQGCDCCFDYAAQGVSQPSCISYPSLSNHLESPKSLLCAHHANDCVFDCLAFLYFVMLFDLLPTNPGIPLCTPVADLSPD